ncbi:Squalene/phytoene synthase-domain-containing protein [Hypoxylon cercidicola]|nr:Squalene/phytoene synthase-domain-containing protein [Hypoxylon cercidicola]
MCRSSTSAMAYDYALVHLTYTIPLAGLLTFISRPLFTKLDLYKTVTLILVAFFATLPWDSYLIRHGVWSYPPDAIAGPRLFGVPAEELFFFVVQTYITSLLYILVSKPVLHAQYLTNKDYSSPTSRRIRTLGQGFLIGCIAVGASLVNKGGEGTYLGLILVWACPFALLTWSLSGYFLIKLPLVCVATPIIVPTVYLWVVDELALGRGTWAIESGTKLGWQIWGSLEVEEAVFFLVTNTLIVFGLVAFDRALAVLHTFPEQYPHVPQTLSPGLLIKALLADPAKYDMARVKGIREAVETLRRKSRSFYLASSTFPGRLRIDLVLLYSFCRIADDLVDESGTDSEALGWINKLTNYLDLVYGSEDQLPTSKRHVSDFVEKNFPRATMSALELLPTSLFPRRPLDELLEGFKTDLSFANTGSKDVQFPINDEADLETYAHRVASTVGELCLWLVFHHCDTKLPGDKESSLVIAAQTMGHALQYVNIARDILVDAEMRRVYLPRCWLKAENLTPQDIIRDPRQPKVEKLRQKLLDQAFEEYERSRDTMDLLPREVRGPLIVAVESYMEIGRVLREKTGVPSKTRKGRATVPRSRRIWVAWKNLSAI